MGLGMQRGTQLNPNMKSDAVVTNFVANAGLNVQNFPQYLAGIVASGRDLASLSDADWGQLLGPMQLGGERKARVHMAISELRMNAAKEDARNDELALHRHLMNGGDHPGACRPDLMRAAAGASRSLSRAQQ